MSMMRMRSKIDNTELQLKFIKVYEVGENVKIV